MATTKPSPAEQLEQILHRYKEVKRSGYSDLRFHSEEEQTEIITAMVAAIERLAPRHTYYFNSLQVAVKKHSLHHYGIIASLVGIVESLKTAYESGYLHQIEELIRADLFSDFLDMGEYLLKEGYKDPAAVIIGGVLEEHLRKLCLKNSVDITVKNLFKKAETMNVDLANSDVYNRLDQKSITAWLDLRNKAAHDKYTEYTDDQVEIVLLGIRDFIARFPA